MAIEARDINAVLLAVAAMGVVILAYDQLVFRPIVAWADKSASSRRRRATGRAPGSTSYGGAAG